MLIKYYYYKTNINFIYPTEDSVAIMRGINWTIIVINCHPYFFILIIFIYLILHMAGENRV